MEEQQQTPEETPGARKKRKQHEAYRRWYISKGQAYKQKRKERDARAEPEPVK